MYEIYCDGNLLYKADEEELIILSASLSLEINNSGSLTFSIPSVHPMYNNIEKFKSEIVVKSDDEYLFYGRVTEESLDLFRNKTIFCEGELAFLNDSIQRPSENHDITVRQFLELLINNHNSQVDETKRFVVGAVTVTDSNNSLYRYTNYENTLTAIKEKLVDGLKGYLFIRHADGVRYIDYLKDMPDICTQTIQFGENLLDYSSNINASDIATRLIPLGARLEESSFTSIDERVTIKSVNGGLDYIQANDAIAQYGIVTKIQKWDDVNTPSILLQKGREYLQSVQWENMVLNISAIDLHLLNPSIEQIRVGDQILCISEVHGLNKMFPVQKMDIDLLNPSNNKIQLGTNADVTITAKSNTNAYMAEEANEFPISNVLKSAKDNASSLIKMATNGFIVLHMNASGNPDELLIMDTPDIKTAQKVWRWNVNGLGYSNTGYNGTYGLAMTMDGAIVADRITSGTMKADRISGGSIDANNVTINNLNASKITSGTMSANYINGGTIDASNVNVTNLNASNISTGTMSANKLSGGEIDASKISVKNLNADNINTGTLKGISIESNNAKITGGSIQIVSTNQDANLIQLSSDSYKTQITPSYVASAYFRKQNTDGTVENGATGNFYDRYGANVIVKGGIITKIQS